MTIDWAHFTPGSALAGGILIWLAAAWLSRKDGRILGASGLLGGLIPPRAGDWPWRVPALAGLIAAPLVARFLFAPAAPVIETSAATLIVGGLNGSDRPRAGIPTRLPTNRLRTQSRSSRRSRDRERSTRRSRGELRLALGLLRLRSGH